MVAGTTGTEASGSGQARTLLGAAHIASGASFALDCAGSYAIDWQ